MTPDVVVVIGVARSGTSCVSGMLSALGVRFDDGNLLPPTEHNPRGYFESAVLNGLLNRQVREHKGMWQDEHTPVRGDVAMYVLEQLVEQQRRPVGIKDTRLVSCGVPFVKMLSDVAGLDVRVVVTRRSARANAASLTAWHDRVEAERLSSMLNRHVRRTERELRRLGLPVHLIAYEAILKNPLRAARELASFIDAPPSLVEAAAGFVDASLNHHGKAPR